MRRRQNSIPVYQRLADDIKGQIEAGILKNGDMIPPEGKLAESYGISRMTVRQGLSLIAEIGLISTIKGKGTFVQRPDLNKLLINLHQPSRGEQERYRLLEVKLSDDKAYAQELGLDPAAKMIFLRGILYKDGTPIAIEDKYLPYIKGTPLLETHLDYADFPEVVACHHDSVPVRNDVLISVSFLTREQAELLQLEPSSSALAIKQVIYSKNERPLGISNMVCHKDRFQLKAVSYPYFERL